MAASDTKPRLFYGWAIVAGAWIMYMINQAAFTWGFTVFVDPLAQTYQWSRTSITIAWAVSLGWGLLLAPWFGRLFDRHGPRPVMLIGGVLGGVGWAVMPFCTSYWTFLASLVLLVGTGINGAIGPSVGSAAIAQWFKLRRSFALGIYFTGSGGAGLVLIPIMSLVAEHSGWQTSARMLGVTTLLLTLLVVPFMRFKPEPYGLLVDGGNAAGALLAPRPWDFIKRLPLPKHRVVASLEFTLAQALRTSAFWFFTLAVFLRYFGMGITQVHQMPHMLAEGVDPLTATVALSLALTINIPARIAVGWMGDVYDKKWLLNLLALAGAFALLSFALLGPEQTAWVWVYALFWGVGLAMLPLQAAWVADTFGRDHYGSINSMTNSLALSGRIVGALAAAVAYDVFGNYTNIMLLGAIGFGVGALVLAFLPSPRAPAS